MGIRRLLSSSMARALLAVAGLLALAACTVGKDSCELTRHCLDGDYCEDGTCVEADSAGRCWLTIDGADGCTYDEVCAVVDESGEAPEYRCRRGICGAGIENDDDWDDKDNSTCLIDRCHSSADCLDNHRCLIKSGAPFGMCSSGDTNSLCLVDDDCELGSCIAFEDKRFQYGYCDGRCASLGGICRANTDCYSGGYGGAVPDAVCPTSQQRCCRE